MGAASLIGRDVRLERNASPVFAPRASLGHRQRDPLSGIWYMYLGFAEICRGRLEALAPLKVRRHQIVLTSLRDHYGHGDRPRASRTPQSNGGAKPATKRCDHPPK